MELQIRGHGLTVTDDLRAFVVKRAKKLDQFVSRVVDAKLELRARHNRVGPDTITAQLTIQTGRHILRAEEDDPDAAVAIDRAVDKLERQVRRFHEKRADRKRPRPDPRLDGTAASIDGDDGDDAPDAPDGDLPATEVVRTKRFSLKPMGVDEAIEQMDLLGHDFYLFHNADEEGPNVLYRRRDGSYGLLAPERS